MNEVFRMIFLCVVVAIVSFVVREQKKEYGIMLSIVCGVLILLFMVNDVHNVIDKLSELAIDFNLPISSLKIIFKAMAISIITESASVLCRDMGENSIAIKAELIGKIGLIYLAFPMIIELLDIVVMILRR